MWRIIKTDEGDAEADLSSGELISLSLALADASRKYGSHSSYFRVWEKIQSQVEQAFGEEYPEEKEDVR